MIKTVKSFSTRFSQKKILMAAIAFILIISAGTAAFQYLQKDVHINDNGVKLAVKTFKKTVGEVLEQNKIDVKPEDYINLTSDTKLKNTGVNDVQIKRAIPVHATVGGTEREILTYRNTVEETLAAEGIVINPGDRLEGATLADSIVADMNFKIVRVAEETVSETVPIPYNVVTKTNTGMDKGAEKTVREGVEGKRIMTFKVVLEDGIEVLRDLLKDSVLSAPVDKIVEVGTILNYKTARGGTIRYDKVLDMRATAYTASFRDTGKNPDHPAFGITYTGIKAHKGVIAVDPKVIPLGTRVYVEVAGNTPDYGYAVAADIGGAIKGNLIDLYFDDQEYVDHWGCKRVKVYILAK